METLKLLYPFITGALVVPLVTWIKTKLPKDFPIQSVFISAVLNFGVVYFLAGAFAPELTMPAIINLAFGAQVTSQIVHAGVKTKQG